MLRWGGGFAVVGGRRCIVLSLFFGEWVIGEAVFWRSPNAALCGGIGGAQRIREVGSATSLRLVAPPEVSAAHRLLAWADAVWVSAAVPVLFREPMGGESGDGGYGGRRLPGRGDAVGLYNAPDRMADSAPGALPPDPRQGLLAPGPPPRGDGPPWNRHPRWRVGGATAFGGAVAVGAAALEAVRNAVGRKDPSDRGVDSAPGALAPDPRQEGMATLGTASPAGAEYVPYCLVAGSPHLSIMCLHIIAFPLKKRPWAAG